MLLALDCVLGSDQVKFLMKILGTTRQAVWQTAVHHHYQNYIAGIATTLFCFRD